jgi:hypothetical protein
MDARARTIRNVLYSGDQYLVPFFQRRYAWGRKHWDRLLDDLAALADDNRAGQHFLGPLVCTLEQSIPGELPRYLLIDGQQRLTTLTIVLIALRDLAVANGCDQLAGEITEDYLTHKRRQAVQRYKLVPRVEDREVLFALIDRAGVPEERDSGIEKASHYFRRTIEKSLGPNAEQRLKNLFGIITDRLSLVVITINDENPFEIFESLNSTGLPLEQADLVRNYLFMQVPTDKQEEFNRTSWAPYEQTLQDAGLTEEAWQTAFYRNYLMRSGHYVDVKTVYVSFKEQHRANGLSLEAAVGSLSEFARIEGMLRNPSSVDNRELRDALKRIAMLDIATANPLLMNLVARYQAGNLTSETLLELLGDIESFALRRSICGESTRAYGKWFTEAIGEIGDNPVEDLRSYWGRRGWPDDDALVESLSTFQIYRRESKKLRLILERLEASHGHKEPIELSRLTVEHVMPQTINDDKWGSEWRRVLGNDWEEEHERWVHTLGNLTLTGYNSEMSNRPFADKRRDLANSNLELNKSIAEASSWDTGAIAERAEVLATQIAELWSRPPDIEYEQDTDVEPDLAAQGRSESRRAYWTRLVEQARSHLDLPSYPRATSRGYLGVSTGRSGVKYWVSMNAAHRRVGVHIRLRGRSAVANFEELRRLRTEIESELGEELIWEPGERAKTFFISSYLPGVDVFAETGADEALAWHAEKLMRFVAVFGPRIKPLQANRRRDAETLTATTELQLKFWTQFAQRLAEETDLARVQTPRPQYWFDIPLGRVGIHLSNTCSPQNNAVGVRVYLSGDKGTQLLSELTHEREAIEAEVGQGLQWNPRPDKKDKVIVLERAAELGVEEDWPEVIDWMVETTERFRLSFGSRIARAPVPSDGDENLVGVR